jgi:adenylate kinase
MEDHLRRIDDRELFSEVLRRYRCLFRPSGSAVFLGPRGAGKTTQAKKTAELNCWCHVSMAEVLQAAGSAKELSDDGKVELVYDRITQPLCRYGAVFDGFPQNKAQAEKFDAKLAQKKVVINQVVEFKGQDAVLLERIQGKTQGEEGSFSEVLQYYQQKGKVVGVDAGKTVDEVWSHVRNIVSKTKNRE